MVSIINSLANAPCFILYICTYLVFVNNTNLPIVSLNDMESLLDLPRMETVLMNTVEVGMIVSSLLRWLVTKQNDVIGLMCHVTASRVFIQRINLAPRLIFFVFTLLLLSGGNFVSIFLLPILTYSYSQILVL